MEISILSWLSSNICKIAGITSKTNPLKIIDPKATIILEGDYVDRGALGHRGTDLVVLLKIFNPDQFIATRGNHEDPRNCNNIRLSKRIYSKVYQWRHTTHGCDGYV